MEHEEDLARMILAKKDRREEPFPVPEWGVTLLLRHMNGSQRVALEQAAIDRGGKAISTRDLYLMVWSTCVLHPHTHEPLFTRAQAEELLDGDHDGSILQRVAVRILSGASLGKAGVDDATADFS